MQLGFNRFAMAFITQRQDHARVQESQFAQTMFKRRQVELGHREDFGIGIEGNFGPGQRLALCRHRRITNNFQRLDRIATGEFHVMLLAITPDAQFQQSRQGVHNRHTHAMQTARNLIGVLVKLTTGMQLGHDDLGCRNAFFLVQIGRDATAVIADRCRPITV